MIKQKAQNQLIVEAYNSRHGLHHFLLKDYNDFIELPSIAEGLFDGRYVFRGHHNALWRLEPSLTRLMKELPLDKHNDFRLKQLQLFCKSLRMMPELISSDVLARVLKTINEVHENSLNSYSGQLKVPSVTPQDEVDVWSIGQHNGLKTPLLDWSRSYLSALFFAFYGAGEKQNSHCAVYALNIELVGRRTSELRKQGSSPWGFLDLVEPIGGERKRIRAQNGLFSIIQSGNIPIEKWVTETFEGSSLPVLIKFNIPRIGIKKCLDKLKIMGYTAGQLFPDLDGACRETNYQIERDIDNGRK